MKLTLAKITQGRSLQRCWDLTDAQPVRSFLPPYTEFVPADLRIWWNAEEGQPVKDHTLHIYAWPAERELTVSAHWTNGHNHAPMPEWIRELSDVVHEDLIANATGANGGTQDSWDYSVSTRWTVEDADPVQAFRNTRETFPSEVSIWHSFHAGQPDRPARSEPPGGPEAKPSTERALGRRHQLGWKHALRRGPA
jgi:hypothetical protein